MNKDILILTINFNKAKTFVLVEPLYFSFWHSLIPPLEVFLKLGYDLPKKKASEDTFSDAKARRIVHQLRPSSTPYWVDGGFIEGYYKRPIRVSQGFFNNY